MKIYQMPVCQFPLLYCFSLFCLSRARTSSSFDEIDRLNFEENNRHRHCVKGYFDTWPFSCDCFTRHQSINLVSFLWNNKILDRVGIFRAMVIRKMFTYKPAWHSPFVLSLLSYHIYRPSIFYRANSLTLSSFLFRYSNSYLYTQWLIFFFLDYLYTVLYIHF